MSMKLIIESWDRYLKEIALGKEKVLSKIPEKAKEIISNTISAQNAFSSDASALFEGKELSVPSLQFLVSEASNPNRDIVKQFSRSLYSGKRSGFLSYYPEEDLAQMNLFLVKGHDAGFAIKTDGDIVSVHNNSSLKGLASVFLNEAKKNGGSKLDHFDGFLSGLYRNHGFTDVYEVYQWDENYKPDTWNFDPVDILDPKTSIYAQAVSKEVEGEEYEMKDLVEYTNEPMELVAEDGFEIMTNPELKANQYKYGRPDVIFRKL